jgi:hypothetical protein
MRGRRWSSHGCGPIVGPFDGKERERRLLGHYETRDVYAMAVQTPRIHLDAGRGLWEAWMMFVVGSSMPRDL